MKTLILIIIVLASFCQANIVSFHKRQLYFNQEQNVCISGYPSRKDLILLGVNFGAFQKNYYADGGTCCSETLRKNWDRITPADYWDYYAEGAPHKNVTYFKFNQTITTKYSRFLRRPMSMIATSVIVNPTLVND